MIILFCSVPLFLFCGGCGLEIYKFDGGGNSLVTKLCLTLVTPWMVAYQAPLSRQGYWSGLPFPSPGDLPSPGIEPRSLALQVDSLPSEPRGKPCCYHTTLQFSSSLRITTAQLASVIIHIGLVATYQLRL